MRASLSVSEEAKKAVVGVSEEAKKRPFCLHRQAGACAWTREWQAQPRRHVDARRARKLIASARVQPGALKRLPLRWLPALVAASGAPSQMGARLLIV